MRMMKAAWVQERIKRLTDDIERTSGAGHPSYINPPLDNDPIEDGDEYGDPFEDRTPDFVKEAYRGWESMPGRED